MPRRGPMEVAEHRAGRECTAGVQPVGGCITGETEYIPKIVRSIIFGAYNVQGMWRLQC